MTRMNSAVSVAALLFPLAACSPPQTPAPPPPALAATVPAPAPGTMAAGGLDGVYRAPQGGVSGNSICGTTRFAYPIRVTNGVASMQTVSQGRLSGSVAPDGSLLIQNGNAALRGQFSGDNFTGTYSVRACAFTLNYTK